MVDKSLSPDIVRLSERLSANPDSKLFVPLAEAYLKSGMRDEALFVLTDGVRKHPTLVSGRLMLGKILIEKGALSDAKIQFEQAIEVNPENIPSLKNLALIDEREGKYQDVLASYRKIISIDPHDKEIKSLLASLEAEAFPPSEIEVPLSLSETIENEEVLSETSNGLLSGFLDEQKAQNVSEVEARTPREEMEEKQPDFYGTTDPVSRGEEEAETEQAPEVDLLEEAAPLATPMLAELYMSQRCYQEAVDIYQKVLLQNPSDLESQKGLESALAHVASPEKKISSQQPVLSARERKIRRLQHWLDTIESEARR